MRRLKIPHRNKEGPTTRRDRSRRWTGWSPLSPLSTVCLRGLFAELSRVQFKKFGHFCRVANHRDGTALFRAAKYSEWSSDRMDVFIDGIPASVWSASMLEDICTSPPPPPPTHPINPPIPTPTALPYVIHWTCVTLHMYLFVFSLARFFFFTCTFLA